MTAIGESRHSCNESVSDELGEAVDTWLETA